MNRVHPHSVICIAGFLLGLPFISSGQGGTSAFVRDRASDEALAEMKQCAAGRKGYVVWESRRPSGSPALKYRIWKRNLDGSGLAMISGRPHVGGYSHLGPKISPDGRYVVFAGIRWKGGQDKQARTILGADYVAGPWDAWVVEIDPDTLKGGKPRELTELRGRVGGAGEDHFFEWKDAATIYVYIKERSAVHEVDVRTGRIGKLAARVHSEKIVSSGGKYIFRSQGGGAGYAPIVIGKDGKPTEGPFFKTGGCQSNISSDDTLFLWASRPGQISSLDLRNNHRRVLTLVEQTIPANYNYMYFPAIAQDMSYIAVGGGDEHSHSYADYEIFLVHWGRDKHRPLSAPVRYTFNDRAAYPGADPKAGHALDRWPSVWAHNPDFVKAAPALKVTMASNEADDAGARNLLADLEKIVAAFENPAGAEANCDDPAFAAANDSGIHAFLAGFAALQDQYPNSRAMLDARSLALRYAVPVPPVQVASEKVLAKIRATVVRTSPVPKVKDIAPYTEALVCAEYEVNKVLSGEMSGDSLFAYKVAMSDGKILPAGKFKKGDTVTLDLGTWEDQHHYHSHPLSDDISDLDVEPYFVLRAIVTTHE